MYTSFDETPEEVVFRVYSKLLTGCFDRNSVAETMAYSAAMLLRGSGAFVDLTGTLVRPVFVGTAKETLIKGILLPEKGGRILWGRIVVYRFDSAVVGVVDPEVLVDSRVMATLVGLADRLLKDHTEVK